MNFSSSNFSTQNFFVGCFTFQTVNHLYAAFCIINDLLIIPLYVTVLYLGFHQWKHCCFLSTLTTSRHSDLLTYNMVAMGLIEVLAVNLYLVGAYTGSFELSQFGLFTFSNCWYGKLPIHTLICIECYVAVVHPVTYLSLKNKTGRQIRTSIIGGLWLQLFVLSGSAFFLSNIVNMILYTCLLVFAFIFIFFCCISVLWALKRAVPGQANRDREQIHQSKRRAFFTILTIMCTVLLTLVWVLHSNFFLFLSQMQFMEKCLWIAFFPWFCLPCNTVLPLLYLHRTRKQLRYAETSE